MEEKPIGREEYIQRVLSAYRQTPGTAGTIRQPDRLMAAQFQERGVPWLRSKTHWFWPRRAGSFVRPDLRRSARFDPWLTSRQSSKKCWSCASAQSTSSICATGSNASPKRVADSPSETKPPHPPRLRRG